MTNFHSQRTLNAHGSKPIRENAFMYSKPSRPFCQDKALSVKRDPAAIPFVGCLLKASSPFTVLWRIPHLIINALYAMVKTGANPHIGIEVLKFLPSFADAYAAFSIPLKKSCFGVFATVLYVLPNAVLVGFTKAVGSHSFAVYPGSVTPTGNDPPSHKMAKANGFFGAAVTYANNHRSHFLRRCIRYYCVISKSCSGWNGEFFHV